jgi:hypothetical protein
MNKWQKVRIKKCGGIITKKVGWVVFFGSVAKPKGIHISEY